MFAFLSLLFVLIVIFLFTSTMTEGFQQKKEVPPSTSLLPDSSTTTFGSKQDHVIAHELPGEIPNAPYQQIAATSPLPYQDTTMIKANQKQVVSLLEMLKGFLGFEAQELEDKSDPTIQLPLTTARSDVHTLQMNVDVMERNPGVPSTITLKQLNEISSNLAYLQEKVRLSTNAGSIELKAPAVEPSAPAVEGFQNQLPKKDSKQPDGAPATLDELVSFVSRIQGEMTRLSASGTNDPNVTARVGALNKMKVDIQTIIDQVHQGTMKELEIPILKKDLDRAFPILGKPTEPLPQLVNAMKLPAGIANMLPSNVQKDPDTMRQISDLVDKYADQIMKGVSATFSVTYSPQPSEMEHKNDSTIDKTGFPSASDLNHVSNKQFMPESRSMGVTDRLAPTPMDAGRGPSQFDWQQRAKEIESQVEKRGLKPADFGIMPKNTKVSNEFSWKGYARMICTRLQATMDPALPETCGCPPMDWKGWRISK